MSDHQANSIDRLNLSASGQRRRDQILHELETVQQDRVHSAGRKIARRKGLLATAGVGVLLLTSYGVWKSNPPALNTAQGTSGGGGRARDSIH